MEKRDLTVLVVDDNRDAADSLAALLRAAEYRVSTAYDGRAAIEASTELQPDVVVLDIGMPKLTGYEVAKVFRRWPDDKRPVLIAVTAWGRESDRLRALMSGFAYHFSKPLDPTRVVRVLADL